MSLSFLLDENLPPGWRKGLLKRDPSLSVRRVGDPGAPPLQAPDPEILAWCAEYDFILVTNNRHSMPGHLARHVAAGGHIPGIFVIAGGRQSRLLDDLVLIAGASLPDEYQDQIRYLPVT